MRLGGLLATPVCAGGAFLNVRPGGALAALVLEVAQSLSIYTSAVHALLCMASLFASTNLQYSNRLDVAGM